MELGLEAVERKGTEEEDGLNSPAAIVGLAAAVAADTDDLGTAEETVTGGRRTDLAYSMSKGFSVIQITGVGSKE